ncbi:MAG: hypothetical protein L0206_01040, partial [Actinobacteria bacterium]|nr:hypothetical protein [Actinomycetota bacterium]
VILGTARGRDAVIGETVYPYFDDGEIKALAAIDEKHGRDVALEAARAALVAKKIEPGARLAGVER